MGGVCISSREQYIDRCRAYLGTAQTGVLNLDSTTLLLAYFKTKLIRMERTIIFCMLFFFSSTVLAAASHRAVKYRQILLVIEKLEHAVKDKDVEWLHTPENPVEGCVDTALSCFKNGTLQLQPLNSQVNATFTKAIRVFRKYTIRSPGKQCESSCESYKKKPPKEFLTSFAKLIQKLLKNEYSTQQS
ncbi:interleukin-21 [Pseudopipra pipra]|uniref:interleukin-21 n=1 Tax=Pseudopipra pipra TaxID=415032 RepID=UPI00313A3858